MIFCFFGNKLRGPNDQFFKQVFKIFLRVWNVLICNKNFEIFKNKFVNLFWIFQLASRKFGFSSQNSYFIARIDMLEKKWTGKKRPIKLPSEWKCIAIMTFNTNEHNSSKYLQCSAQNLSFLLAQIKISFLFGDFF